jgi:hypothetical protein
MAISTISNANAITYAGAVLQVVSTTKTDTFTTTSQSPVDVTGLTVSITPKFATSKILVIPAVNMAGDYASGSYYFKLVRNSTNIAQPSVAYDYVGTGGSYMASAGYAFHLQNCNFLDSPATTSATTYKIQVYCSSGTASINRRTVDTYVATVSTITVMEIAA